MSVALTVDNHAPFIAHAIEGVLMQETDVDVELVIGVDCPSDDTRSVVEEYVRRHPTQIRVLVSDKRLGTSANLTATLQACTGDLIAACNGDDIWTVANKLQAQVGYLEEHTDCSMYFHNTEILEDESEISAWTHEFHTDTFTLDDVLITYFLPASSILIRKRVVNYLPTWFSSAPVAIWALAILATQKGNLGYIDSVMSRQRKHATDNGLSKPWAERIRLLLNTGEMILKMDRLDRHHDDVLNVSLDKQYRRLTEVPEQWKDRRGSCPHAYGNSPHAACVLVTSGESGVIWHWLFSRLIYTPAAAKAIPGVKVLNVVSENAVSENGVSEGLCGIATLIYKTNDVHPINLYFDFRL